MGVVPVVVEVLVAVVVVPEAMELDVLVSEGDDADVGVVVMVMSGAFHPARDATSHQKALPFCSQLV